MGTPLVGRGAPVRYGIVIAGEIGPNAARPLEGMTKRLPADESVISAVFSEEARLAGLIHWLGDRGIEVVSVNPLESEAVG
jgi:hypothetical protein